MNIELHIERLILDGLPLSHGQRVDLQAAVEAELTRLLTTGGLRSELLSGVLVRSLDGGEIQFANMRTPSQLGSHIAQAVHKGIGVENNPRRSSQVGAISGTTPEAG
jgi:hypothetical protein